MKLKIVVLLFFFFPVTLNSFAAEDKVDPVKESELLDFKAIRDVLKNDMLGAEVEKNKMVVKSLKTARKKRVVNKFNIPNDDEFWTFFSEFWLVKNAMILKWDFQKPDYGIESSFKFLLEKLGIYEKNFKILLVNTPDVTHMALPSNSDQYIFILSVPFIRTLDLSKLEISVLLFEDYLRVKAGYFKSYVTTPALKEMIGSNYFQKSLKTKVLKDTSKRYDNLIFDKGFSFQQQFEVTKQITALFKSEMKLWNTYYRMLKKIDNLVKSNILYQKYVKIYPSPELQMNWIKPSNKKF